MSWGWDYDPRMFASPGKRVSCFRKPRIWCSTCRPRARVQVRVGVRIGARPGMWVGDKVTLRVGGGVRSTAKSGKGGGSSSAGEASGCAVRASATLSPARSAPAHSTPVHW